MIRKDINQHDLNKGIKEFISYADYSEINLAPVLFKVSMSIPDAILHKINNMIPIEIQIQQGLFDLRCQLVQRIYAENKKDDILVDFEYKEYVSLWDHVKHVINKKLNLKKWDFKVHYNNKKITKIVNMDQYILYPSLQIDHVYKRNYDVRRG